MRQSDDLTDRGRRRARNSPRRPRITKEPEERRQEIIETALELLAEKGYEDLNVQDITDKMNVSPGLCYRYFKSKTEIFAAASEHYAVKMVEQLRAPLSKEMPAIEKIDLVISHIFQFVLNHQGFEARYSEAEDIRAIYLDNVAKQLSAVLFPVVEQGINEKTFHCKKVAAATHFLIFGLVHTFHQEIPADDIENYMDGFLEFTHDMFSQVLGISNNPHWPQELHEQ